MSEGDAKCDECEKPTDNWRWDRDGGRGRRWVIRVECDEHMSPAAREEMELAMSWQRYLDAT